MKVNILVLREREHNSLCTGGGEISITLIFVSRRSSRRQRVKTFSAALDPQYAGSDAAGTMAMLDPVLVYVSNGGIQSQMCKEKSQDHTRRCISLFKDWHERMGQRHKTDIIDVDFVLELSHVEASRIAQVVDTLSASIQE